MKLVSVFDYNDLPCREWQEFVCDEQSNDSFAKVYLDGFEEREEMEAAIATWAKDQGAHIEEGDSYPYVLFSISW